MRLSEKKTLKSEEENTDDSHFMATAKYMMNAFISTWQNFKNFKLLYVAARSFGITLKLGHGMSGHEMKLGHYFN